MTERSYRRVADTAAFADLMRFLFSPNRSIAIVVVTNRRNGTGPCVPPSLIQQMCGSSAQVYLLSAALLPEFNQSLHNVFGIAPSGMRIFRPRMTMDDHHLRHPIWNEQRIDLMVGEQRLASELDRHVNEVKRFANGRDHLRPTVQPEIIERPRPTRPILRISLNG